MKTTTETVRERPILFRGSMVRAILNGTKTQTRRLMKPQPEPDPTRPGKHWWPSNWVQSMMSIEDEFCGEDKTMAPYFCPYGKIDDRLWVRETWQAVPIGMHRDWLGIPEDRFRTVCRGHETVAAIYRADGEMPGDEIWQPSIFMPRWACRLELEIIDVRVERLCSISDEDGLAESFDGHMGFLESWGRHNGPESIAANPWVWALTFKLLEGRSR